MKNFYPFPRVLSSSVLLTLVLVLPLTLSGVEIPGGSNAEVEGVPHTGLLKIVNGKRAYYASLVSVLGFEPKANGMGCILLIATDKGVQSVDVATSQEDVLKAIRLSRD
jgi:hypothetical protein